MHYINEEKGLVQIKVTWRGNAKGRLKEKILTISEVESENISQRRVARMVGCSTLSNPRWEKVR